MRKYSRVAKAAGVEVVKPCCDAIGDHLQHGFHYRAVVTGR